MVDVANVVNLQITRETRIPTVAGLETIAILSKEAVAHFGADERVKTYGLATALESLIADGFSSSDETYLAVSAIASDSLTTPKHTQPVSYTHLTLPTTPYV